MDDPLGPRAILELRDPRVGLHAWVVVDNVAAGPAIGGVRLAADVGVDEVRRLARAMTLKNAAAGLPHGGAKAAIVADPRLPPSRKEELVRAFARLIGELASYIPGPDLGTDESAMAFIHDEIGRAVGLPRVLGGLALDAIGATAVGLVAAAEVAAPACKLRLAGARVAVQGFGAVGQHAARLLAERGARLVAACDSSGGVLNGDGLDVAALVAHKRARRRLRDFAGGRATDDRELVTVDCDLFVPAARPDVIRRDNADRLRARLVVQGANLPVTDEAERRLYERGVLSLPDFVVNAGGVICAAVEYRGGGVDEALALVRERVAANSRELLERSGRDGVTPRDAALAMAMARVEEGDELSPSIRGGPRKARASARARRRAKAGRAEPQLRRRPGVAAGAPLALATDMRNHHRTTVEELMTTAVISLHANDSAGNAREQMSLARIRHIPVVDAHERVIGIVSSRDLLRSRPERPIRELMTHPVITVRTDVPAHRAAALLREKKFGSLPVVGEDEQLVGIVTESDFLAVAEEALGGNTSLA